MFASKFVLVSVQNQFVLVRRFENHFLFSCMRVFPEEDSHTPVWENRVVSVYPKDCTGSMPRRTALPHHLNETLVH